MFDESQIFNDDFQPIESTDSEFERPNIVQVQGPFSCKEHGRNCTFVFNYSTRTYHHQIKHKNGSKSICKSTIELKRW